MHPLPVYTCDGCGACCKTFPIFVTDEDAALEPRLHSEGQRITNSQQHPICLYPLPFHEACCFLGSDNHCGIYQSRPQVCREVQAGGSTCQAARQRQGIGALEPEVLEG